MAAPETLTQQSTAPRSEPWQMSFIIQSNWENYSALGAVYNLCIW